MLPRDLSPGETFSIIRARCNGNGSNARLRWSCSRNLTPLDGTEEGILPSRCVRNRPKLDQDDWGLSRCSRIYQVCGGPEPVHLTRATPRTGGAGCAWAIQYRRGRSAARRALELKVHRGIAVG